MRCNQLLIEVLKFVMLMLFGIFLALFVPAVFSGYYGGLMAWAFMSMVIAITGKSGVSSKQMIWWMLKMMGFGLLTLFTLL